MFDPYTAESVDSFIRSLYNGSLEEPLLFSDHLLLYRLSRTFQVDWLTSDITLLIKIGVSHATVFSTLSMALEMSDPSLTHASHDILSRTYLNDVSSPTESTWWELDSELVEHVLRMTTLRVCTEIDVFVHVLYWVERNISLTNREECVQVLQSVRIFSLPHIFRESFLFPYISIISQKFFLALKYPQVITSTFIFPYISIISQKFFLVFKYPQVITSTFLFPYISIISQKFFLALKYPQVIIFYLSLYFYHL